MSSLTLLNDLKIPKLITLASSRYKNFTKIPLTIEMFLSLISPFTHSLIIHQSVLNETDHKTYNTNKKNKKI